MSSSQPPALALVKPHVISSGPLLKLALVDVLLNSSTPPGNNSKHFSEQSLPVLISNERGASKVLGPHHAKEEL